MKKVMILITLLTTLTITGCTQSKVLQIEYDELPEEQQDILTLTGNRVLKYSLKNLPNDKSYELKLVYEVYENNEKLKEEEILGMLQETTNEKLKDVTLAMNIQDDKIRCISGDDGKVYNFLDIEEDIESLSQQYLTKTTKINFDDEIYLFHGIAGENGIEISELGSLSDEDKNKYISGNELNVFIKLVCKEK